MPFIKKKTVLFVTLLAVLLAGTVGYRVYANVAAGRARAGQLAQSHPVPVQLAQVERHDITPVISVSANLEPVWTADVSPKVDGRIETLDLAEGDPVHAGQVIATMDAAELAAQVAQAQGNLLAAQSSWEQARLDYDRYSVLAGQNAVSAQLLDNARTKKDLAAGQVKAAEGSLTLAQERLNAAQLTAPRNGTVSKRYVQAGAFVRAGSPVVALSDASTLLAKAVVGESQVGEIAVGAAATIRVGALDREFTGQVSRISPQAALPARTFTVEIAIPNSDGALRAGMFAKADFPVQVHSAVLAVPESALVLREDQKTVFVVNSDNKVEQRLLTLGYTGNGWAEVMSGLNEGDIIVTGGQNKVKDGVEVVPSGGGDNG